MRALLLLLGGPACAGLGIRGDWHLDFPLPAGLQRSPKVSHVELPNSPRALATLFLAFQPAAAWQLAGAEHCRMKDLLQRSCHGTSGRAATSQRRVASRRLAMQETTRLTPLPDYLGRRYLPRDRRDVKYYIKECTKKAVRQAIADGVELMELEFPPLIDTKGQYDDFTNIEVFDANQAFVTTLAVDDDFRENAPGSTLWLVYADPTEAKLARKTFADMKKGRGESTQLSLEAALKRLGKEPVQPQDAGSQAFNFFSGLFGDAKEEQQDLAGLSPDEKPKMNVIVQPGEYGPLEDYLNVELMKDDGVPLICLNGALDKLRSNWYTGVNMIGIGMNQDIRECADRFFAKFESMYYLKPIKAGAGWLFRVYPEPWQLYRDAGDGTNFNLVETYDERPTLGDAADRLSMK